MNWREFKPTIFFLLKFTGLYMLGSIGYGLLVTTYEPQADPITITVTEQATGLLTLVGWPCSTYQYKDKPTVGIVFNNEAIVSVYEGCNGINVMIVLVSFLLSFGRVPKAIFWFLPLSLLVIHLSNLLRVIILFFVSIELPDYVYFGHKYFFTAFIYAVVIVLWFGWVKLVANPTYEKLL